MGTLIPTIEVLGRLNYKSKSVTMESELSQWIEMRKQFEIHV